MLEDKIGIRFDTVKTGAFAHGISPFFDLSPAEATMIQKRTDLTYDLFLERVSAGRNMPKPKVDEVAQGRVWIGQQALEKGLVDEIGDLNRAIESAARLANLDEYRLSEYPQVKDPLTQILERFMDLPEMKAELALEKEMGKFFPAYKYLKEMETTMEVQARLPFILDSHH